VRCDRREKTGGQQSQVSLSALKAAEPSTMPFAHRLTCTIDDACEVTGLGRTKHYELIGAGRIVTTTIGRRRLGGLFHLQRAELASQSSSPILPLRNVCF
jgi:excisionase family DNA binding protein